MCIIVVKKCGAQLPDRKTLENCFNANPDGAGYMIAEGNNVNISKGFLKFAPLYDELRKIPRLQSRSLVIHFRIATHGAKTQALTHPFPLSNLQADLDALNVSAQIGIAHNGIIHGMKTDNNTSDTAAFISRILYPLRDVIHRPEIIKLIKMATDTSKFAIMYGDGTLRLVGEFLKEKGIFYSNSSYIERIVPTYSWPMSGYYDCGYGNAGKGKKGEYNADYWNALKDNDNYLGALPEKCPFCGSPDWELYTETSYYCPDCQEIWNADDLT